MKTLFALTCAGLICLTGCEDDRKPDTTPDVNTELTSASNPAGDLAAAAMAYEPITEFKTFDVESFANLREEAAAEGKVLVVDFWATWCTSCVAMFPHLHEAMHEGERDEKVMLVSVTQDAGEDDVAQALKFVNKKKAGKGAYHQPQDAVDPVAEQINEMIGDGSWAGSALPAVFVFDTEGNLAYAMTETSGDVKDWVAGIAAAADKAAAQ